MSNLVSICLLNSVAIIFSNILAGAGVSDIGLKSAKDSGGFDFGMGTTLAFFHIFGKTPFFKHAFTISQMGVANSGENSSRRRGGISHGPGDLEATFFNKLYVLLKYFNLIPKRQR